MEGFIINFFKGFVITEHGKRSFRKLIKYILDNTSGKEEVEELKEQVNEIENNLEDITDVANEALSLARGAQIADTFATYQDLVEYLNDASEDEFILGKNFYIKEIKVGDVDIPDCWISAVNTTSVEYDFVSETDFVDDLTQTEGVQVGYYTLNQLEGGKVNLDDYTKSKVMTAAQYEALVTKENDVLYFIV